MLWLQIRIATQLTNKTKCQRYTKVHPIYKSFTRMEYQRFGLSIANTNYLFKQHKSNREGKNTYTSHLMILVIAPQRNIIFEKYTI